MLPSISMLLAAAAQLSFGPTVFFHNIPLTIYTPIAVIPHDDRDTSVLLLGNHVLYDWRVRESQGRAILNGVDAVRVSASSKLRRVVWTSAKSLRVAPLLDDDSIDLSQARALGSAASASIACNDTRCVIITPDHATIIDADSNMVADNLPPLGRCLATDPSGFLCQGDALRHVANDGTVAAIAPPAGLGTVTAADFDGSQYVLGIERYGIIAVAPLSLAGSVGDARVIVDELAGKVGTVLYQSKGLQLAFNGSSHLLVTHETTDYYIQPLWAWPTDAVGYLLGPDLSPIGAPLALSGHIATSPGPIAYGGGRYWVAWLSSSYYPLFDPGPAIFLSVVDDTGTQLPGYNVPSHAAGGPVLAIAGSESHTMAVWSEQEPMAQRYAIRAKLDATGSPITLTETTRLSAGTAKIGDSFLVAAEGDHATVGAHFTPDASAPVDMSFLGDGSGPVAVAANGREFLVATSERGRVVAAGFGADGVLLTSRLDLGAIDGGSSIAVASDGVLFALIFQRNRALAITIADGAGNVIATRDLGFDGTSGRIAWSGADYVATAGDGTAVRTWRLTSMGDVVTTFDVKERAPTSLARCGNAMIGVFGPVEVLAAGSTTWDKTEDLVEQLAATRSDYHAVLLDELPLIGVNPQSLVIRDVVAAPPRRTRAVR